MRVRVKWYGPSLTRDMRRKMADSTAAAAKYYNEQIKVEISMPGPPRSRPYRPPHAEHWDLYNSFMWEIDRRNLHARVGSGLLMNNGGQMVARARYLEYGTSRMRMRPHIRLALYNKSLQIGMIWARPW